MKQLIQIGLIPNFPATGKGPPARLQAAAICQFDFPTQSTNNALEAIFFRISRISCSHYGRSAANSGTGCVAAKQTKNHQCTSAFLEQNIAHPKKAGFELPEFRFCESKLHISKLQHL